MMRAWFDIAVIRLDASEGVILPEATWLRIKFPLPEISVQLSMPSIVINLSVGLRGAQRRSKHSLRAAHVSSLREVYNLLD
jgi:hypothetical protein